MLTRLASLLLLVLGVSTLLVPAAFAGTLDQAKVALHLQPYNAKDICLPASQGGQAPDLIPCVQYVTAGLTGTGYNAYLTVSAYSPATDHPGVAGLSCGIEYNGAPGAGADVLNWVLCADLEFPNAGPYGDWPASGGGNRLTFDYTNNCQLHKIPGYESEGVVAVFGAFYVYAYDADVFSITPNLNLQSGPEIVVGDCDGSETDLLPRAAGSVAFTFDGTVGGCNPCIQDCAGGLDCSVPAQLNFGSVLLGETRDLSFAIRNLGSSPLDGSVASSCASFQVIGGAGAYSISPGDSVTVTVRYVGTTSAGYKTCDLYVGGLCPTVLLTASTPPPCTVMPTSIHLGTLVLGDTADAQFSVANNKAEDLVFELDYTCPDYAVLEGTGPFTLSSGQSMTFTVRLAPTEAKAYNCTIDTGTECASVSVTALVLSPDQVCEIYPLSLDFGYVRLGLYSQRFFEITNGGPATMTGTVSASCPDFSIVSGGGAFSLATNQTRTVAVRFTPSHLGLHGCQIEVSGGCTNVSASGYGTNLPGGGQSQAVIALHAGSHSIKGDACLDPPEIACSEYTTRWPLGSACNLWLVAARGGEPGLAGISCGILYQNGALGASTRVDGLGVDVAEWNFCASGLQFPNGPTGLPEDEWPASGGGNRMTWNASVDCQTTAYGLDGIHAVAGYFYLYAYTDDRFEITPNSNLLSGPELQVGDCNNAVWDLAYPAAAAVCAFGNVWDFNPCGAAVPVRLLSFGATRVDAGAEVRWAVAGADNDHLGFEVYRGLAVGDRARVSTELLSGREAYVFVDADPPSTAVSYWLAERSRTGETSWHGPVELEAASVAGPALLLRHASPNPFLGATRIAFRTGLDGPVTVRIFDTAGREVARLFSGAMPAGDHEVAWDGRSASGSGLPAGIYFYRVETAQGGAAGKVVLIR